MDRDPALTAGGLAAPADDRIAVAVVSWNTRDLLARCLDALHADAEAGLAEVWVVDNGSSDGSRELVAARYPWARLVTPDQNLGFGPAVNLVAARTATRWLVAANADVAVEPGALAQLRATAAAHPDVGAVGPRLVLPDGSTQNSVRPFPGVASALLLAVHAPRFSRRAARALRVAGHWRPAPGEDVPWVTGALMLLSRRAFEQAGGFDPDQWLYAEDMDLCWRLHEHGWRVLYEERAVAHHAHSAGTSQTFAGHELELRITAASYLWMRRRRGPLAARLSAALGVLDVLPRLLAATVAPRRRRPSAAVRAGLRAELRSHLVACGSEARLRRHVPARPRRP